MSSAAHLLSLLQPARARVPFRSLDQRNAELAAWWGKQPLKRQLRKSAIQTVAVREMADYLASNRCSCPDYTVSEVRYPDGSVIKLDPPEQRFGIPPSTDDVLYDGGTQVVARVCEIDTPESLTYTEPSTTVASVGSGTSR